MGKLRLLWQERQGCCTREAVIACHKPDTPALKAGPQGLSQRTVNRKEEFAISDTPAVRRIDHHKTRRAIGRTGMADCVAGKIDRIGQTSTRSIIAGTPDRACIAIAARKAWQIRGGWFHCTLKLPCLWLVIGKQLECKFSPSPCGKPAASSAASRRNVPEPHIGSQTGSAPV